MLLSWTESYDDQNNTVYEATSCVDLGDDDFAHYRIRPELTLDTVVWSCDETDEELGVFDEWFSSPEKAKEACEAIEASWREEAKAEAAEGA